MQDLFLKKFNWFQDLVESVAKEAISDAITMDYIEEEIVPNAARVVLKQQVAVESLEEQITERKDEMFDNYLEHILHEVLCN